MDKKAQGLSLTTIVVAALALLVLVVLVLIFSGRMKIFTEGTEGVGEDCASLCQTQGSFTGGTTGGTGTLPDCSAGGNAKKFGTVNCCCTP